MIQKENYKISLEEHKLIGKKINCTAVRNFLCTSFRTNPKGKKEFDGQSAIKKEQGEILTAFITDHNLWIDHPPKASRFLTQGGEAEVYFLPDHEHVICLNSATADRYDFYDLPTGRQVK
jgi:hypothetical protein